MTNAEQMRAWRANQRSYGRCINCRVILPEGWPGQRCEKHRRQHAAWQAAHRKPGKYRAARARGACDSCGGPAQKFSRCLPCRRVAAARLRVKRSS